MRIIFYQQKKNQIEITLSIPQEYTEKQPQKCEELPQASHLCTYAENDKLLTNSICQQQSL
jgi:hypothetical protein